MREIDDTQVGLVKKANLRRVDLYELTTYSDRDQKTVATVHYWSDAFRKYPLHDTDTPREFLPVIRSRTGPNAENVPHIQDFGGSFAQTLELVCANLPDADDVFLLEAVRGRLFRATMTVYEVMIRDDQDERILSNLTGWRHTVVWRGEVSGIVRANEDTFTLQCVTIDPVVPWLYAFGTYVDKDDLGKRLPLVYGRMKMVEAVGLDVGAESTLAEEMGAAALHVVVSDAAGFHPGNVGNHVIIDGELMQEAPVAGNRTIPVANRPLIPGTTDHETHAVGAVVVEIVDSTWCVAGHPVKAIHEVFARRPDGRVVLLPDSILTKTPVDAGAGPDGETIATVTVDQDGMQELLQSMETKSQVEVTQQPAVTQQTTIDTLGIKLAGWAPGGSGGDVDVQVSGWDYTGDALTDPGGKTFTPAYDAVPDAQSVPTEIVLHIEGFISGQPVGPPGYNDGENDITVTANVFGVFTDYDIYLWWGLGASGTLADNVTPGGGYNPDALKTTGGNSNGFGFYGFTYEEENNPGAVIRQVGSIGGSDIPPFDFTMDQELIDELVARGINVDNVRVSLARQSAPTSVFTSSVSPFRCAREAEMVFASTVTTDIEVAGDEANQTKVAGSPPRYGANRLKLYANVDGWTDDGLTTGTLLEDFPEIADHFIEVVCGVTDGGDHSAGRSFVDDSLGSLPHATDMRALGTTFPQLLSRLAWESRCNAIRTEGQDTPPQVISDLFAIRLGGDGISSESIPKASETGSFGDEFPATAPGFLNEFTISLLFLAQSLPGISGNLGGWFACTDAAQTEWITFGDGLGDSLLVRIGDVFGTGDGKEYQYDTPPDFIIDDGTTQLHALALTWDGTDVKLFLDGAELTPSNIIRDDAFTFVTNPKNMSVGGGTTDDDFPSFFFGLGCWDAALSGAELAAVADVLRAGGNLGSNSGAYVSSANLKQQWRPGFAGDFVPTNVVSGGADLTADGDAVSDIIDSQAGGFEDMLLRADWFLDNGDEDVTGTTVLEWGDAADLSDAAPINPTFLTGGVPADFDFTTVAGVPNFGTLRLHYDPNAVGAKRYLRWTVSVTGIGAPPQGVNISFSELFVNPSQYPGDANISSTVKWEDGGLPPATDTPNTLVSAPEVVPGVLGATFYRYAPGGTAAQRYAYGFPVMGGVLETDIGVELDAYVSVQERPRDTQTIKTRFRTMYAWDASRGGPTDGNAFRSTQECSKLEFAGAWPTLGALAAAEAKWGRRDEEPMVFLTVQQDVTATDTLGYLAHTALLDTRLWEFEGVPWTIAYRLDPGDTIRVPEVPWDLRAPWLTRVLGIAREPDTGLANLTLFAVQRWGALIGAGTINVTGAGTLTHKVNMQTVGAAVVGPVIGAGTLAFRVSMTGANDTALIGLLSGSGTIAANVRMGGDGIVGPVVGAGALEFTL